MALVSIHWSATNEDDADFSEAIVKQCETLLPPWADCSDNAESAVGDICEDYFDIEWMREYVGDDESASVRIRVHKPESVAGDYLVDLDLIIKARARKLVSKSEAA